MKICILVNNFGPPWTDGNKNSCRFLAERLALRNDVVCVGVSSERKSFEYHGCRVELVKSPCYSSPLRKVFLIFGVLNLFSYIRNKFRGYRPDVVLSNLEAPSMAFIGWLMCRRLGGGLRHVQMVYADIYSPMRAPLRSWLTEYLPHWLFNNKFLACVGLKLVDRNIAVSRYLVKRLEELGARNVCYAPIGVDTTMFRPRSEMRAKYPEAFVLGYLGHLTYVKGASMVLDAFRRLKQEMDIRLLLSVTTGSEWKLLGGLINDDKVTLLGPTDAAEFFASCDVYLLPRRASHGTANLPNTILEAMACGTAVVTSALPGIDEIVHDGQTGYLVKPNDLDGIVSKMEYLASHEDERRAVATAGRQLVAEHYTWDRMAGIVEEAVCGKF